MSVEHKDAAIQKRHAAHNWEYADATARAAATGMVTGDVGKLARQLDNNTLWMLTDDSPVTWVQVGASVSLALDDLTDVTITSPAADQTLEYNGSAFVNRLAKVDIAAQVIGTPAANQICLLFVAVRAFTLPSGLTGTQVIAGVAATGSTTFTILKNGGSIGTLVWAGAGTVPTVTFSSNVSFAAGDILKITAPGTPDATLADIAITLRSN